MDVVTAFLHGNLEEEIYIQQPQGFSRGSKVCRLQKSLYGLKQSPRQWNKRFDEFIRLQGYAKSRYDPCVYFRKCTRSQSFVFLLIYVDDMLLAARSMEDVSRLKLLLAEEFEMKDLGAAKTIIGMEIVRDRAARKLWLSQSRYVEKVLKRFNMENSSPVSTPLAQHFQLSVDTCPTEEGEKADMSSVPYKSAVGSLMYAMVSTRPDIAQAVGVVSRFMANPGRDHWEAVKWIMRYLRGTSELSITFGGECGSSVMGYVDADYAGDVDTRRSTTGFVFSMYGGPISWRSTLQSSVALSTTEAEYMAAAEAAKEGLWLRRLTAELGREADSITVFCDSQSAIHLAKNHVIHSRSKHIGVRYHFIREVLENGELTLEKISTDDNAADMLTKTLPTSKFRRCLQLLHME